MAQSAFPAEEKAATSSCAGPRKRLFRVLSSAEKLFRIGIICVGAAIIQSIPSGVLQPVVATTNATLQRTPVLSFGGEAPSRVTGMQFISEKPPQPSVPFIEKKKRQSRPPQVQLLAEHRRLAASKQKQVEDKQGISDISRKEYGQRGHSSKSEQVHETTDDISNGYGVDSRTKIRMAPMHHPVADNTSFPAGIVHSTAAAETFEESEVQRGKSSAEGSSLGEPSAANSLPPNNSATLYSEILHSDIHGDTPAFGIVPDGVVPVDSPLSGPLEELYIPGHPEAYDTLVKPKEEGRLRAFPWKAETANTQDEPTSVADATDHGVRTADRVKPSAAARVEPQGKGTQQVRWQSANEEPEAAAEATDLVSAPYRRTGAEAKDDAFGLHWLASEDTDGALATPSSSEDVNAILLPREDVTATVPLTEMARVDSSLFTEDFPAASSNYRSQDGDTDEVASPQNGRGQLSDGLWDEAQQNGQVRGLHSTQDQPQQQGQEQNAAVSLPATVHSNAAEVTHDSASTLTADGTGDAHRGVPLFDSVTSGNPLSLPESAATDDPVNAIRGDSNGAPHMKDGLFRAQEKKVTPSTEHIERHDRVAQGSVKGDAAMDPHKAASLFQPEPAGKVDPPTSGENMAFSSPPRRIEPQEEISAAGEAQAETEGVSDEEVVDHEVVRPEEASLEENEESGAEDLEIEAPDPVVTESDDIIESPTEGSGESPLIIDPREGACSPEELTALTEYFSNQSGSCAAYRCIDEAGAEFLEKLQEHYGAVYEATQLEELAGLFAACYCRCPMMKCEVDYVMDHGSPSCKAATVDYCETSNEKFVQRCTSAAQQLPLLYDIRLDTAGFKVPCRVCRREDMETAVVGPGPVADGPKEEEPSQDIDSSSTTTFENVVAESSPPAEEGLLDQGDEDVEGSYEGGAEGGNADVGMNLDEDDEDDYDEELPFLQLDQLVSTVPTTSSSSPIEDTSTREVGGVLPTQEEQDPSVEEEPDSLEDTKKPIHPSTPTVVPSAGNAETEATMDDQSQKPSPGEGQEEGVEAPVDGVTTQSSAFRQAGMSIVYLVAVVAPLLIPLLAM